MQRLINNGYPKKFLKGQLRKVNNPIARNPKPWVDTVVIPYKPGTSEATCRVLNKINIRVASKSSNSLGSKLVHIKVKIPIFKTKDYIYKITCLDCSAEYIEQTVRELGIWVAEHRRKTLRFSKNETEYQALIKDSATACHALDTGHTIDFENIRVIRKNVKKSITQIYTEKIEITKSQTAVNRVEGIDLSGIWKVII